MAKGYPDYRKFSVPISVVEGGTGTDSPALAPGPGIEITGSWPNHTIINTSPASALGDPVAVAHGGTGTSTGSITGTGALTFAAGGTDQDIKLTPSGLGNVLVPRLNNIRFADQFPGANAGEKIAAAIADLPSTGGTVDARGLEGPQTISQNVFAGVTKPVRLLLGAASAGSPYTLTAGQVITVPGTSIEGLGRGATVLNYTPATGTAITVAVAGNYPRLVGFTLTGPGQSGNTASGILISNGGHWQVRDVRVEKFGGRGFSVTASATMSTNANLGAAYSLSVSESGVANLYMAGNNANGCVFYNFDVVTSPVGIHLDASVDATYPQGNLFLGGHIGYNTTQLLIEGYRNRVEAWMEDSSSVTTHINFAAGSSKNVVIPTNWTNISAFFAKISDAGLYNLVQAPTATGAPSSVYTFPQSPAGDIPMTIHEIQPIATAAPNAKYLVPLTARIAWGAANTQNWTNTSHTVIQAQVVGYTGATGTVAAAQAFGTYTHLPAGMTLTNFYQYHATAPVTDGVITNRWSFKGDANAGIAEIADGIKTGGQIVSTVATGTAPLAVSSTTEVANLRAATATDLAAGSILSVAKGGTGTSTPSLVAGTNITISGSWPNQTVALASPITGTLLVGSGSGDQNIRLDGGAGYYRLFAIRSAGLFRWQFGASSAAESGSNAGSDFAIWRYSDAGALVGVPFFIRRSDGQVGIGNYSPGKALDVSGDVRASGQLISTVVTGTAPLAVSSTTEVANLRAATATDLAAGSILSVAKGGTGRGAGALPIYANNAAAVAGGLAVGDFYRTGGDPDLVCVVH
jgi:hypothetical protein